MTMQCLKQHAVETKHLGNHGAPSSEQQPTSQMSTLTHLLERDKGPDALALDGVVVAHHRRLGHMLVRHQRALHLQDKNNKVATVLFKVTSTVGSPPARSPPAQVDKRVMLFIWLICLRTPSPHAQGQKKAGPGGQQPKNGWVTQPIRPLNLSSTMQHGNTPCAPRRCRCGGRSH